MAGDAVLEPSAVLDPSAGVSPGRVDGPVRPRVIAFANQKGGVGKTTTTINLARALSRASWRPQRPVLVIDFDPQGNTTSTLAAVKPDEDQLSIADAVVPTPDAAIDEVLVETIWPGVWLAPAITESLTQAEELIKAAMHGREHCLAKAIAPVRDQYDILIDLPPALGLLTINGLTAADKVEAVAESELWSADGLGSLRKTVAGVQQYSNPSLTWGPLLLNKWRGTKDERELRDEITQYFSEAPVWKDVIPLWVDIRTTLNQGLGLDEGTPKLRELAESFDRLGRNLLEAE